MSLKADIQHHLDNLPEALQAEVLDFVLSLEQKLSSGEQRKPLITRKHEFLNGIKQCKYPLPDDCRFDRKAAHER